MMYPVGRFVWWWLLLVAVRSQRNNADLELLKRLIEAELRRLSDQLAAVIAELERRQLNDEEPRVVRSKGVFWDGGFEEEDTGNFR